MVDVAAASPATGSAAEVPAAVAVDDAAAVAAAPAAAPHTRDHPRYREMILAAIEALKEREGSSKRAISKFIAQSYGDLPAQHDKLLAQSLRRMTGERVLRLVRRSYKIANPSSPLQQPPPDPRPRGRPRKNFVQFFVPTGTTVKLKGEPNAQSPRRGRPPKALRTVGTVVRRRPGRPRKVPAAQAAGADAATAAAGDKGLVPLPVAAVRKRGRPPKVAVAVGEKRRPGRPRKADAAATAAASAAAALMTERLKLARRKPGGPSALGGFFVGKRRPGRPRKLPGAIAVAVGSKPGRGPGRPPKAATAAAASAKGKRRPGRPRKVPAAAAAVEKSKPDGQPGRPSEFTATGERRKRGRPRKVPRTVATAAVEGWTPGQTPASPHTVPAASPASDGKRKRGRPPKVKQAVAGDEDPANPTAVKRRGRPPKKVEQVQSTTPAEEEIRTDEAEKQVVVEAEKKVVEAEKAGPSAPEV